MFHILFCITASVFNKILLIASVHF